MKVPFVIVVYPTQQAGTVQRVLRHILHKRQLARKETMRMLLENKNAISYGAGGSMGGAATWTFAREGATAVLTGRIRASLEPVAADIKSAGETADVAVLDALDEQAAHEHAQALAS